MELYHSGTITITSSRITIGGTDYPVRNISAVSVELKSASPVAAVITFIIAGLCGVCGVSRMGPGNTTPGALLAIIACFVIAGLGVYFASQAKAAYHLFFQTNSGRVDAYTTRNQAEAEAIRSAIRSALDGVESPRAG